MSLRFLDVCAAIDALPAMTWAASADGAQTYLSDDALKFLGLSRAGVGLCRLRDLLHPEDAERMGLARADYRCEEEISFQSRVRHVSGEFRWVAGGMRPMKDPGGQILGWMGSLTEIPPPVRSEAGAPTTSLTGEQIRAGRALARLEQAQLARLAGVSLETVKRLEGFRGPVEATTRTVTALVRAFESVDVLFDLRAGAGPGVRLLHAREAA